MVQVGAAESLTRVAGAGFVQRTLVGAVPRQHQRVPEIRAEEVVHRRFGNLEPRALRQPVLGPLGVDAVEALGKRLRVFLPPQQVVVERLRRLADVLFCQRHERGR